MGGGVESDAIEDWKCKDDAISPPKVVGTEAVGCIKEGGCQNSNIILKIKKCKK